MPFDEKAVDPLEHRRTGEDRVLAALRIDLHNDARLRRQLSERVGECDDRDRLLPGGSLRADQRVRPGCAVEEQRPLAAFAANRCVSRRPAWSDPRRRSLEGEVVLVAGSYETTAEAPDANANAPK